MNLKECYDQLGGNFEEVVGRLQREQLVERFLIKFLADTSFSLFETSLDAQNYEDALRGVHTLKGVCQNLSFVKLYESSAAITLALKENNIDKAMELKPQLEKDYHQVIEAIEAYQASLGGK